MREVTSQNGICPSSMGGVFVAEGVADVECFRKRH